MTEPVSPEALWDQLGALGISKDTVAAALGPMMEAQAAKMMSAFVQEFQQKLPDMFKHHIDQASAAIADQVKGAMGQTAGAAVNGAPAAGLGGMLGNPVIAQVVQGVLSRVLGPAPGTGGGMESVVNWTDGIDKIFERVMIPMQNIYGRGASDERARMTDLFKMGATMPWETPSEQVGAGSLQQERRDALAHQVAERMRLSGDAA